MDTLAVDWAGLFVALLIGLSVGSYANVVIFRAPREGLSSLRPRRSFCPGCRRELAWRENVPILSWLLQRGRCRTCRMAISLRYPAIELLTATLFVWAWWLWPPHDLASWARLGVAWYLAVTCLIVSLIDLEHLIIPDTITYPGIVLGLVLSAVWPELHHGHLGFRAESPHASGLVAGVAGALAGGGSLAAVGALGNVFLRRRLEAAGVQDAMGWGDVKWMALAGAFLGVLSVLSAILMACFLGALVGILAKILARIRGTQAPVGLPFGPFLALAMLAELVSPELAWQLVDRIVAPA